MLLDLFQQRGDSLNSDTGIPRGEETRPENSLNLNRLLNMSSGINVPPLMSRVVDVQAGLRTPSQDRVIGLDSRLEWNR